MEANTKDRMRSDRVSLSSQRIQGNKEAPSNPQKLQRNIILARACCAGRLLIHKTSRVGEMLGVDGGL